MKKLKIKFYLSIAFSLLLAYYGWEIVFRASKLPPAEVKWGTLAFVVMAVLSSLTHDLRDFNEGIKRETRTNR